MPRPNFAPRGARIARAWSADMLSNGYPQTQPRNRAAIEAEIEMLRRELASTREAEAETDAASSDTQSRRMLWCALALCAAAMLFTLIAVFYRG